MTLASIPGGENRKGWNRCAFRAGFQSVGTCVSWVIYLLPHSPLGGMHDGLDKARIGPARHRSRVRFNEWDI